MDLYEAIKNGASVEKLKGDFEAELKAATERIEAEKRTEPSKVESAREDALKAFIAYLEAVIGVDSSEEDKKEMEKLFLSFEREMIPIRNLMSLCKRAGEKKNKPKSDEDIIKSFLDTLS